MVQWRKPSDMSGRGVLGFVLASVVLAWFFFSSRGTLSPIAG